jgi:hypothetical protein
VHWSSCPAARPSSQTGRRRAGWSGAPCRLMGYRRDADLCAWRGLSWPARARVTIEWPAVRVLACGGGVDPGVNLLRSLCLTQRRERSGRVDGLAHQLAQRALPRAAGDRRGEHVFGRLGGASDGTRNVRRSASRPARIWLQTVESGSRELQAILHAPTARRTRPAGRRDLGAGRTRSAGGPDEIGGRAGRDRRAGRTRSAGGPDEIGGRGGRDLGAGRTRKAVVADEAGATGRTSRRAGPTRHGGGRTRSPGRAGTLAAAWSTSGSSRRTTAPNRS